MKKFLLLIVTMFLIATTSEVSNAQDMWKEIQIKSSYDGEQQTCRVYKAKGKSRPLLVAVHSWSSDVSSVGKGFFQPCIERDWNCIAPDFRGPNMRPEACASPAAFNDVMDAVQWALSNFDVDSSRVFMMGSSGGGHMSLFVAAHSPSIWTAVSSWVPISDLERWYWEGKYLGVKYPGMMEKIMGGPPGTSKDVDAEYLKRSPLQDLWRALNVPIEILTGIHDGHYNQPIPDYEGFMSTPRDWQSVPCGQTIRAFNEIAKANGDFDQIINEDAIEFIEDEERIPEWLDKGDIYDPTWSRKIHLQRQSKRSRMIIYEGGHNLLFDEAFKWLDRF